MKISVIAAVLLVFSGSLAEAQNVASSKRQMIQQSIERYSGNCPCPFSRARNGSRCGGRSAWSRPGGASPLCYGDDISDSMLRSWMQRNGMAVTVDSGRTSDDERKTIRSVQLELNRLGCNTGTPDGVIGRNSREALRQFAGARGIRFQVADFRSQLFLRRIEKITGIVCQ